MVRGGGGSYGWLLRCSHKESHLSTACTAVLVTNDNYFLEDGDGEGGSSPATSPSQAAVWDHFHLPLVAPADPPR